MRYSIKILGEYVGGNWTEQDLKQWLGMLGLNPVFTRENEETFIEIETPANRGDLFSAIGILRTLAPFSGIEIKYPEKDIIETSDRFLPVEIECFDDCFFYAGRIIESVKVEDSPSWLKEKLISAGFRSVNNVVDITNIVFWEFGQPLHAFDLDLLKEKIIVRRALDGEFIVTLDGVKRELSPQVLVISDSEKPVAVAGVMGGLNSEVTEKTTNLFIESAFFNPVRVRRSSKFLGLVTDASARFEKRVDPSLIIPALDRCCRLINEICGGKISKIITCGKNPDWNKSIDIEKKKIVQYLGCEIPDDFIIKVLTKLGCRVEQMSEYYRVIVPEGRSDLERDVDIIEEIAKYWGYDRIPEQMPLATIAFTPSSQEYLMLDKLRDIFVKLGFTEAVNLGFYGEIERNLFGGQVVEIINPLSRNYAYLRNSLIPGLLQNFRDNFNRKIDCLSLFEVGNIYCQKDHGFFEKPVACAGVVNKWDFYSFKGMIESLLVKIGYHNSVQKVSRSDTGDFVEFLQEGKPVAKIYLPGIRILKAYDLEQQNVFLSEINLEKFLMNGFPLTVYKPVSKYLPVKRDLALIVPDSINWKDVERTLFENIQGLENIEIFDIYRGKGIPEGCTGIAISVVLANKDGVLKKEDIDATVQKIVSILKESFSILLRQ